jgi:ATP-binding cassette, subfamily B, bacterial
MVATASNNSTLGNPLRRILQVLKLERRSISSIYFFAIISGLIQLSLPLGIQSIINFVLGGSISTSLVILIILVVSGVFLNGWLQVTQMGIIENVQQKLFVQYACQYAYHIPNIDIQRSNGYYLPEVVNRFFDIASLQKSISKLLLDIPTATVQILFGLILLSLYHPLFIVFSIVLALLLLLMLRFTGSIGLESSLQESDCKYKAASWLQEVARVTPSFKFSKGFSFHLKNTDKLVGGYLQARTRHYKILQLQYWLLIIAKVLITAAMLVVGSVLLVEQQLNVGQFIAAEIVILLVINAVEKIIVNLDSAYDVLTSIEKLAKITELPAEAEGIEELASTTKNVSIEVRNCNFAYNPNQPNILEDINFSIAAGEKLCIMGAEGSGKSTLLQILSGSYTSYLGNIFINQIPLRNYSLDSLRKKTGLFLNTQDIFEGTVIDNIAMGDPSIRLHNIVRLADEMGYLKKLEQLEQGLHTQLHPRGSQLSTNNTQSILLLRALINNPSLLLLEEPSRPWSTAVQQYLFNPKNTSATMCIVCNNEAVATQCDKVIYLQEGKIVAQGKWNDIKSILQPYNR